MSQLSNENVKDIKQYRTVRSIESIKFRKDKKVDRIHIVLDLYECTDKSIAKADLLEQKIKKILTQFQLEPKVETFYQFQPFGVTAIVCAEGAHLTIHTWPEYNSAAIDLYYFNSRKTAMQICDQIKTAFKAAEYEMKVRRR